MNLNTKRYTPIAANGSGLKEVADLTDEFHYGKRKEHISRNGLTEWLTRHFF